MEVVGIDPSLTGCAVWTSEGQVGEFGSEPFGPDVASRHARYEAVTRELAQLLPKVPFLVVVEGNQGRIQGAGISLVEFSWHLKRWLHSAYDTLRLIEVPPTSLKMWAAGKGNADKVAVASSLTKRYGEEFETNNIADAYALMMFGMGLLGTIETTKQQRAVYAKLGLR